MTKKKVWLAIQCWCHKGESLGVSINNPRNIRADEFDTKEQAERWNKRRPKDPDFVYWVEEKR